MPKKKNNGKHGCGHKLLSKECEYKKPKTPKIVISSIQAEEWANSSP